MTAQGRQPTQFVDIPPHTPMSPRHHHVCGHYIMNLSHKDFLLVLCVCVCVCVFLFCAESMLKSMRASQVTRFPSIISQLSGLLIPPCFKCLKNQYDTFYYDQVSLSSSIASTQPAIGIPDLPIFDPVNNAADPLNLLTETCWQIMH